MRPEHIYPRNDKMEHKLTGGDCWCEPEVKDGVVKHNSADGREYKERGEDLITGIV